MDDEIYESDVTYFGIASIIQQTQIDVRRFKSSKTLVDNNADTNKWVISQEWGNGVAAPQHL